jgi:hypothetical protein
MRRALGYGLLRVVPAADLAAAVQVEADARSAAPMRSAKPASGAHRRAPAVDDGFAYAEAG